MANITFNHGFFIAGGFARSDVDGFGGGVTMAEEKNLEMTPYDLTKGRITFRHKEGGPGPKPAASTKA